jgi:hypothetical protein
MGHPVKLVFDYNEDESRDGRDRDERGRVGGSAEDAVLKQHLGQRPKKRYFLIFSPQWNFLIYGDAIVPSANNLVCDDLEHAIGVVLLPVGRDL